MEGILFISITVWIGISLLVGSFGANRQIGFSGAFFASLFLSPLLAMLFVLASKELSEVEIEKRKKVYEPVVYVPQSPRKTFMVKLLILLILFFITIGVFGQINYEFTKYPYKIVDDSCLYYNYKTNGSKPYHIKLTKQQTRELLSVEKIVDSMMYANLSTGFADVHDTLLCSFTNVPIYKYNSLTNKTTTMQVIYSKLLVKVLVDDSKKVDYIRIEIADIMAKKKKEEKEKKEKIITQPTSNVNAELFNAKFNYEDDSTLTFKFTEIWTKGGKIYKPRSYFSVETYEFTPDDITKFINILLEWQSKGRMLKENNITDDVEKYICDFNGLEMHFDYNGSDGRMSYYIIFKNVEKSYLSEEDDVYKCDFVLLNLENINSAIVGYSVIDVLTTVRDSYYKQLNEYNNKTNNDKILIDEILSKK